MREASDRPATCDQCGASFAEGATCEERFHELLAFEHAHPDAFGAVHHLVVATYGLQHPRGYTDAALAGWRTLIATTIDSRAALSMMRRRMREDFDGAARVRDPEATIPPWWPRVWPMSVHHVMAPPVEPAEYVARATAWARSVVEALNAAETGSTE